MISGKQADTYRYGFVETSIGSQGRTVKQVILGMSAAMGKAVNMQQLYVSASRAWDRLRLYTDDKDAVRDAAQRDSRKLLALDLLPKADSQEGAGQAHGARAAARPSQKAVPLHRRHVAAGSADASPRLALACGAGMCSQPTPATGATVMSDDNVLEFNRKLDELFQADGQTRGGRSAGVRPIAEEPESPGGDGDEVLPFDKLSHFPRIGDPYAKAHATPVKASLPMLVLLLKDGSRPTFSYTDLRFIDALPPKAPGDGPGLLLRFMGVGTAELEGVGVDRLHGYLYLHRLAWIREWPAGRQAGTDNAVIITRITVTLVEE